MELITPEFIDIRRNRLLVKKYDFVLMHISKKFHATFKVPLQKFTLRKFAIQCCKCGHLELLEWLVTMNYLQQSPDWGEYVVSASKADLSGEWFDKFRSGPIPSDRDFYYNAAKSGQMVTLEWLKRNKYTLIENHFFKENDKWCIYRTNPDDGQHRRVKEEIIEEKRCKEWQFYARTCFVSNENVVTLEWLKAMDNFSDSYGLSKFMVNEGSLSGLKLLIQHGLKLDVSSFISKGLCARAAARGDLEMLKWLRDYGCQWDSYTCMNSATKNSVNIVKWAILNGCPYDDVEIITSWVNARDVETVEWLLERGCPLDTHLFFRGPYDNPARYLTMEMVQLLLRHGCEWHSNLSSGVRRSGKLKLLAWIIDNGCPYNDEDYTMYQFFKRNSRKV